MVKLIIRFCNRLVSKVDEKMQDDLMDNEHIIMQQLFNGQNKKLTTQQSIDLFDKIESLYYLKLKDRFFELHEIKDIADKEIELIEKYRNGKKKNP